MTCRVAQTGPVHFSNILSPSLFLESCWQWGWRVWPIKLWCHWWSLWTETPGWVTGWQGGKEAVEGKEVWHEKCENMNFTLGRPGCPIAESCDMKCCQAWIGDAVSNPFDRHCRLVHIYHINACSKFNHFHIFKDFWELALEQGFMPHQMYYCHRRLGRLTLNFMGSGRFVVSFSHTTS
jgi:hypothetical protein